MSQSAAKLELSATNFPQHSIVVSGANLEPIFDVVEEDNLVPRPCDDKYILLEGTTVETNPTKRNAYLLEERNVLN